MDQKYEAKQPLTVICKYGQVYLTNGGDLPFAITPTPEHLVADWSEQDPSEHYFFAEISTDISGPLSSVEDYHAAQELLAQEVAAANEAESAAEAEGEEVDAPA